jgi:TonB-linked SusC/RagA family outer membrane protein
MKQIMIKHKKVGIIMTLMICFLQVCCVISAAQNISINKTDKTVREIILAIEESSDMVFFYNSKDVDLNRKASVHVTNESIDKALNQLFANTQNTYKIDGRQIFILKSPATAEAPAPEQQGKRITGKVIDEKGDAVIGASISVKGNKAIGTFSDLDGNFTLQVEPNVTLVISYLGFLQKEVSVENQANISVILEEDHLNLDEIVVIGYTTAKKKDVTGSVTSIKAAEITKTNLPSLNHVLKTQMPIDVRPGALEPGSNPSIEIRGNNVLNGNISNNNPLWVIDGIPMQSSSVNINPNDVVAIDVLQDASAAAIYGSRGANGVIIVTTKHAVAGEEKTSVSYNGWVGVDQVTRKPQLMTGPQFTAYKRAAWKNSNKTPASASYEDVMAGKFDTSIFDGKEQDAIAKGYWTDWFDELYGGTSFSTNHNLTVSTSGKKSATTFSLGYLNQESLEPYAGYNRFNVNLSNVLKVSDRLEFITKILGTYSKNDHGAGSQSLVWQLSPLSKPYDDEGNLQLLVTNDSFSANPLLEAKNARREERLYNVIGSTTMKWNIWDNLTYQLIAGIDYTNTDDGTYVGTMTNDRGGVKNPRAQFTKTTAYSTTFDNLLTYNKEFGGIHRIDALFGYSAETYRSNNLFLNAENMTFEGLWYNFDTAETVLGKSSNLTEWTIESLMFRLNYSLLDRYLFTFTTRNDGSSRLPTGNKRTTYPSFSAAWRISEEPFMEDLRDKFLDNLKLRLSYGNVGKMSINPYSTLGSLGKSYYGWNTGDYVTGYVPNSIPNSNLHWEKTSEKNIGLDFSLFRGRLSGTVDLYDKDTDGLIMPRNLPLTSGFSSYQMNIGKINNKGVQIMLKGDIIRKNDLNWNVGVTFYHNKNAIVDLYGDKKDDVGSAWFIGKPIRGYWGYDMIGVWQEEEATAAAVYGAKPGWPKLRDVANLDPDNPKISTDTGADDRVFIPNDPKWIGSLNTTLTYKGFDLYLNINTRQGTRGGSWEYQQTGEPGRYNTIQQDFWTPENRSNTQPMAWASGQFSPYGIGDYGQYNLSYIRLANVSLGYTLPKNLLSQYGLNNTRIFINVSNPFVYAPDYKGNDPENGRGYPAVTAYQFGLNLNF